MNGKKDSQLNLPTRFISENVVLLHERDGQLVARGPHEHRGPKLIYACCAWHVFFNV
jgi:hypothetical protein